jgi:hypothetical protein
LHCSFKILLWRGNSKEKEKNYQVLQFYAFSVYLNHPQLSPSVRSFGKPPGDAPLSAFASLAAAVAAAAVRSGR